jgi:hypothetical protein
LFSSAEYAKETIDILVAITFEGRLRNARADFLDGVSQLAQRIDDDLESLIAHIHRGSRAADRDVLDLQWRTLDDVTVANDVIALWNRSNQSLSSR